MNPCKAILLPILALIVACGNKQEQPQPSPEEIPPFKYDKTYQVEDGEVLNPERGMYTPAIKYYTSGNIPAPITSHALKSVRKTGKTLVYSEFFIKDFVFKDISEEALESVRAHLEAFRDGSGCKTIVRFAYSDDNTESDHPWDAPVDQTLRHVEQLKPIFQEYADVIYVVQYGFVGSWGEGYYTDYFGMNPKTDEDYQSRRDLMNALLDAVPESRQIAVRYPLYKRRILGVSQWDTITSATAFGPSKIARVAGFNDCFVSSSNDVDTYKNEDDRIFWATESNYISMGGETCRHPESFCNCDNTLHNLRRFHWTYLNEAFEKESHNIWLKGGCYDYIREHLGYRLVLKGAAFSGPLTAGGKLNVKLHIKNEGFASIINYRPMQWVLVNAADKSEKYVIPSPKDPREWKGSQTYVYEEEISLPAGLKAGQKYNLALELPDAAPTLSKNPDYSIRFANKDVWEEATGLNILTTLTAE